MAFDYKLIDAGDLPALKKLWLAETDWGTITESLWQRYFVDTPEEISGVVATDAQTGEVVGQFIFNTFLVHIRGRQVRAFRPSAPIVSRQAHQIRSPNPMHHPVAAMYNHAVHALRERSDGLIYMMPDPRWTRFFKMFPALQVGSFPLWSLPLPLDAPRPLDPSIVVGTLDAFDERLDRLWQAWSATHPCSIVRDARMLRWRLGYGEFTLTVVERDGEPIGFVAGQPKGDRQWLLCDLLAADTGASLDATLAAAVQVAHGKALAAPADKPLRKTAILATPTLEPALARLGFARDNYNFPFVVHVLDPSIAAADVAPSQWYASAND